MSYRKFNADLIFDGNDLLDENHVLITDEDGAIKEIVIISDAGDDIEKFDGILSPGFINCHCHLELSHMKALIPERTGLIDFVFKVVTQRHFPEEDILNAIIKAEDEMLQNSIVAVGDICNNTSTLQQKKLQRLAYYNFIEASGWLESVAKTRFKTSMNYYNKFNQQTNNTAIVPHAPYSVSNKLWSLIQPSFQNKTITIHNQETVFEDELFLQASGDFIRMYKLMNIENANFKASGKSSLQTYFSNLKNAQNIILVHNTFTKEEDVLYAKKTAQQNQQQLFWCLCANANLYIENSLPPLELFKKNNCNIVLGTDSLASNWGLNIMDEMKTINKNFPSIDLKELLAWATLNGANALKMDKEFGSFEKGKKPGLVLIDNIINGNISITSTAKRII